MLAGQLTGGWHPVCAVEQDAYCQQVLLQRQRDGLLPRFPIWDNVCTFDGLPWRGYIDLLTAGFPCQPWSLAGQRQGAADDRNLWPDTLRILGEVRPRYVFVENSPALLTDSYFGVILGQLAEARYDAVWCVLGADDVGAPHERKRLWLLGNADGPREPQSEGPEQDQWRWIGDAGAQVPDATREQVGLAGQSWQHGHVGSPPWWESQPPLDGVVDGCPDRVGGWWDTEPAGVPRVASGIPERVGQLRALGNGWLPLCAAQAWHMLLARVQEDSRGGKA